MAVSIFTDQEPDADDASDGVALSLGTKFFASEPGSITHGRWYFPTTAPSGPVDWVLYSLAGVELARATFSSTSPGWQTVALASPVAYPTPSVELVAVVETPDRYVATVGFFAGGAVTNDPLTSPSDGDNGRVSAGAVFPTGSFSNSCYFADLVFQPDGEAVTGELAATLPALTAAGTGTLTDAGAVDTTPPPLGVQLSGDTTASGPVAATLPPLGVALAGPTSRPVVTRPDTGLVVRPNTGTVVRP